MRPDPALFLEELDALVDEWCEQRTLHALSVVLPAYLAFDGSDAALDRLHAALGSVAQEYSRQLTAEGYQHVRHLLEITGGVLHH